MSVAAILLALGLVNPVDQGQLLRGDLQASLQGVPLHGHHFRAIVFRCLSHYPDLNYSTDAYWFRHPVGWDQATLVSSLEWEFGLLFYFDKSLHVSLFRDDDFEHINSTYWSNGRLLMMRSHDGTGSTWCADVFRRVGSDWNRVQRFESFGEIRQDYNLWASVDMTKRSPMVVDVKMSERIWGDGPVLGSHYGAPMPRYFEHWRFDCGKLHRISLRQSNATSEVAILMTLRAKGKRKEFDSRVPARFQAFLWRELKPFNEAHVWSRSADPHDETSLNLRLAKDRTSPEDIEFYKAQGITQHDLLLNFKHGHGRYVVSWVGKAPAKLDPRYTDQ